jgi:glucosylceramidase
MKELKSRRRSRHSVAYGALGLATALISGGVVAGSAQATSPGVAVQRWETAQNGDRLARQPDLGFGSTDFRQLPTITVDPATQLQYIDGFGSTLNEAGCGLLDGLPAAVKADVFEKVFHPLEGAGHSLVRVPIGLNDFSRSDYTLNDTPGDFAMTNFNIDHDKTLLIPCIKSAQAEGSFMTTASPWTVPKWMKTTNSYFGDADDSTPNGQLIGPNQDPRYYQSMALYLRKYTELMQAEGIHIDCINPQNEPGYDAKFGQTEYSAEQMKTFIRDYLGPEFSSHQVNTCIRAFEWNRDQAAYPAALLADPDTAQYIDGINWHNYDCLPDDVCERDELSTFIQEHPGVSNWMSEHTDIDGIHQEWSNGEKWGKEVLDDIGLGQNGWIYWNLVLNQDGGPWAVDADGTPRSGPQQPQIIVDETTDEVTYLPLFYYEAHLSKFVRPGAHHVRAYGGGPGLDYQAFTNADGTRSLTVINSADNAQEIRVTEGASFITTLAPHAINTFTWGAGSTATTSRIQGIADRCLDVTDGSSSNGAAIQIWDCTTAANQQWTAATDGTIASLGKCLDVAGAGTTNGTQVQLYDCNGTAAQQWRIGFEGEIRNPASGRCLDVAGNQSTNGSHLQIWDCAGTANQKWEQLP